MDQVENRITLKQDRLRRKNYFSKKGMQGRLVGKIVGMVLLAIVVSIGVTSALYFKLSNTPFKGDVPFYYIPEGAAKAVEMPTAFDVLLPGLLVCGIIMVFLTLVIGVFITHRIGGPITNLQRSVKKIAKGDLVTSVKLRQGDEFQDLADDMSDMLNSLRTPIKQVQQEVVKLGSHPDLERFHDLKEGLCKIASDLKFFKTE